MVGLYGEFVPGTGHADSWSTVRLGAERRWNSGATRLAKAGLLDLCLSIVVMGVPVCGHWRKRGRHMTRLREGLDILRRVY